MSKNINPFYIGKRIDKTGLYCPRTEDALLTQKLIGSSNSLFISEERRIGKSSLITNVLGNSKELIGFYIDLSASLSLDSFCKSIIDPDETFSLNSKQKLKFANLKQIFLSKTQNKQELIDLIGRAIDIMDQCKTSNKSPVLVLDEFQFIDKFDDKNLSLMWAIRNKVQAVSDLRLVFIGSIRNKMNDIFTNRDSPLFNQATKFAVDLIPTDDYYSHANQLLSKSNREIEKDTFKIIYQECDGITEDIQKLLSETYDLVIETGAVKIDNSILEMALERIIKDSHNDFETIVHLLSPRRLNVLLNLARKPHATLKQLLSSTGVDAVRTIELDLAHMKDTRILYLSDNKYKFYNNFLKIWLMRKFKE